MSVFHLARPEPELEHVELRAVQSDEERRKAVHLMAAELTPDSATEVWLGSSANSYPGFRPEHTRIALIDGRVVAALRLTTETLQIGEARLKMGGIGWVVTAADCRRRGLASRLLRDTMTLMRAHRYHVSMLFGIPNFYHKFGYATSIVDHSVSLDTTEALCCDNPFSVHRAKPGDIPAMVKLHQRGESQIACTLIRNSSHVRNKWTRFSEWFVLRDDRGKVVAYFLVGRNNNTLCIEEAGLEEFGLAAAVIASVAEIADRESLAHIRFFLPPPHDLSRYLQQFRATFEARRDRNAGGMLAFVDVGETLESMIPEWESRIADSPACDARTELTLVLNHDSFRIRVNRGAVDVAAMPGRNKLTVTNEELIHLITGYRSIFDLLEVARTVITRDARLLASAIFPSRHPFVWKFDQF
jgi:predicted acetyltransferase